MVSGRAGFRIKRSWLLYGFYSCGWFSLTLESRSQSLSKNAKSGAPVVSYPGTSKETSKLPEKTAVDQPPILHECRYFQAIHACSLSEKLSRQTPKTAGTSLGLDCVGCLTCSACRFLSRLADFKDAVQNNEICSFYIICPKRFTYKPRTLSLDLFSRLTSTDISQVRTSATETVTRFRFSLLSLLIFSMDVRHL